MLPLRSSLRSAIPIALVVAGLVSVSLPVSMPVVSRTAEASVRIPDDVGGDRDASSRNPGAPGISAEIARELDGLLAQAPGRVSVVITDPGGAWEVERNADRVVRAASVIKLPILAAMLAILEREAASLDESVSLVPGDFTSGSGSLRRERPRRALTIRELSERMIIESDNTATNALLRRFGLVPLDAEFQRMGLDATRLERRILEGRGDNPTSARDMARLLRAIAEPDAFSGNVTMNRGAAGTARLDVAPVRLGLSPESLAWMRSLLARASNRRRLGRHLPPDVPLEHKTGTLRDLCHDVGIVHADGEEIIVAALVEGAAPGEAERWLGALGRIAWSGSIRRAGRGTGIRIATATSSEPWYSR